MATHYRTCPLCEAMCGLELEVEGPRVVSVRGDADDPFSRGFICPKGAALAAIHDDPDRLRRPIKRTGARWDEIGWEEALELAARGIHDAQEAHGRDAVAVYLGNPTVHNLGASLFGPLLVRSLHTKNRFSATSVDQLPHHLAAHWMFGHQFLLPIPDVDRTDFMLIVGANPVASNGSLMSAPGMKKRLEAIVARGGKVVVVDPRRTETADIATAHHFIRPGADAWLLAALLRIAIVKGRGLGRLASHSGGREALRAALEPLTSERAEAKTGIAAAAIETLATEICASRTAIVYGRFGVSTQRFGGLCQFFINALNLVTGNFDEIGGVMFPRPAVDAIAAPAGMGVGRGSYGRWRSRVRGLPEAGGELPVATLAEEILTEGKGRVSAVVTLAGNPVLSTPNGKRLGEAFEQLDHMVSIDFYLNETTRHAKVILPPPSPLERPHYDVAFHHLAVRNTAKFADALFAPDASQRSEHQIILGLVKRLAELRGRYSLSERVRHEALMRLGPIGLLDLALRAGPYGIRRWARGGGLTVAKLRKEPHGIDLGPLEPCMPERMSKWRTSIDLAPRPFIEDLGRLDASDAPGPERLVLVGRRHPRSNNSWMHNAPKLMAGKSICTLLIHPADAQQRGVGSGATVKVTSEVGSVKVPAEITDVVMRGVVSLPHGFGHGVEGTRLSVAKEHAGASINDLTNAKIVDELTGNAVLSGIEVTVEAL